MGKQASCSILLFFSGQDVESRVLCHWCPGKLFEHSKVLNLFLELKVWRQMFCKRDRLIFIWTILVLLLTRFFWIMVMEVSSSRHKQFKEWRELSWGHSNGECVPSPRSLSFPSSWTCSGSKTRHLDRFWRIEHPKSYWSHKEVYIII